MQDIIPDDENYKNSTTGRIYCSDINDMIHLALDHLDPFERDVICSKYGIDTRFPYSFEEIADLYAKSEETVK